jgi:hypothetical protein
VDRPEPDRLSRETAEGLLSGADGATPAAAAVADLLARARGPAWLDEQAGEEAAVAAFRAARDAPARTIFAPDRPRGIRPVLTRVLSVKMVAVAVATAVGGVALATATLPGAWLPGSHDPSPPTSTRPVSDGPIGSPSTGRGDPAQGTEPPSRAIHELCRAYLALPPGETAAALRRARFAPLVRTAGGERSVQPYCVRLVGAVPTTPGGAGPSGSPGPTTGAPAAAQGIVDAFDRALREETAAGGIRPKEADRLARSLTTLRDQVARDESDRARVSAGKLDDEIARYRLKGTVSPESADRLTGILGPLLAGGRSGPAGRHDQKSST